MPCARAIFLLQTVHPSDFAMKRRSAGEAENIASRPMRRISVLLVTIETVGVGCRLVCKKLDLILGFLQLRGSAGLRFEDKKR
jgi:hypothetical protein